MALPESYVQRYRRKQAPGRPTNTEDVNARTADAVDDYATEAVPDLRLVHPPSMPDPVPVFMVQPVPQKRVMRRWFAGNAIVAINARQQIAGDDTRRTRLFVRNINDTAATVYIIPEGVTLATGGFPLEQGEEVELLHNSEVWLLGNAATCHVAWFGEYEVEEQ